MSSTVLCICEYGNTSTECAYIYILTQIIWICNNNNMVDVYVDTNAQANTVFSTQTESFVSQKNCVCAIVFLIYLCIYK